MLANSFLQLAVLSAAGLLKSVAAVDDPNVYGTTYIQQPPIVTTTVIQQPPIIPSPVANSSSVEGETLLSECADSITACGTTADIKVIRTHNSTSYTTKYKTIETTTVLKPKTRTVTQVVVSTKTTSVEGQCRETIIYEEPTPLTVTVEANTTLVREFVPIVPITVTTTSWVEHKQISQCIIKRTSTLGVGTGSPPSPPPVAQPPVAQQPIAPPPGSGQHNHDRRRAEPAPPSSPGGTGRPSSAPPASSQQPSTGSGSSPGASSSSSTSSSARTRSTP